ncbi:MAG: hypothetical protein COT39_02205 [Parcubacteria group bacterium CG08_land_8_20_14_0_20_48_21]|nr:MAG: hypothetical protein AUK21_01590 [Parcubacteria group bacterium CG2_30_48_51]PIS32879.1 MAG: hypothetical protein COT39_02205 [Parcubacteria group bacterium CG08_land_8_20_14_0_20_48_21]PIW78783.1 MAG: hypothetical protein COZ99_04545 [Parcubacteria group bacterium CG_4_8_14_3_um_filter_48_16]PIY78248.1 MAG: hypothetical protein COY83_00845 [Parcubacteria group bacterium CG_4_10_14_0_8_um_filter_48_154]PIZ77599.1 MAG: hypothetical protein COY03_02230 [bacterium CG_4_10_14_0_2_um_filter_
MNIRILKIGGSLLAPKDTSTLDENFMQNCASQLAQFQHIHPDKQLVLLHGGGWVGHRPAKEYGIAHAVRREIFAILEEKAESSCTTIRV